MRAGRSDLRQAAGEREDFVDRVEKDLREVWPSVFGIAAVFALLSLIPLSVMLYVGATRYWLLVIPSYFVVAGYAGPIIAVMHPLLKPGRRGWEFVAGFLIYLPVTLVVKGISLPEVPLFSATGLLSVLGITAICAASQLGLFPRRGDDADPSSGVPEGAAAPQLPESR